VPGTRARYDIVVQRGQGPEPSAHMTIQPATREDDDEVTERVDLRFDDGVVVIPIDGADAVRRVIVNVPG
jgi:hypothetical protein